MGATCWALLAVGYNSGVLSAIGHHGDAFTVNSAHGHEDFTNALLHHLGKTAEILIFLIGAMLGRYEE